MRGPPPAFPLRSDVWSDGINWSRGHWLNGRLSGAPVGEIIAAVLRDHGFDRFESSAVDGFATGFLLDDPADARRSLETLMEVHGISVAERAGALEFRSRARPRLPIGRVEALAVDDGAPDAVRAREREIDRPDEVALAYRDPMRAHGAAVALARTPGGGAHRAAVASPLVLENEPASAAAAQLLHAARDGRERAEVSVPWSRWDLRPGDSVLGPPEASGRWLIEAIEDGAMRHLSLVAMPTRTAALPSPTLLAPPTEEPPTIGAPRAIALDLPLVPGRDGEGGAAIAAWMRPWRPLIVLTRTADGGLRSRAGVDAPATLGTLVEALAPGPVGPFDRANAILLDCPAGAFANAGQLAVLNGANALAVHCAVGWEVLQFQDADEIAPGRWRLTKLLRARLGTDRAMSSGAAVGADVVALNGAVAPVRLDASERGEAVRWLVGPGGVAPDPSRFAEVDAALGTRADVPLAPVHLRLDRSAGARTLRWIRRSRVDADRWDVEDVPLGEERERYRVRLANGTLARAIETDRPELLVPPEFVAGDGPLVVAVAQLGAREGDAATITI